MKNLSSTVSNTGTNTTPTDNANTFTITTAYRDSSQDAGTPIRIVAVQGETGNTSALFSNNCGPAGASCLCYFYLTSSDSSPKTSSAISYSSTNNTLSCTMDPAQIANGSVASYTYMQLRTTTGTKASGLMPIKTALTIEDVLGSLDKTKVRKIYEYGCDFTFLEGEGLATNPGTCPAGQALGKISATYNFYLYSSATDTNFADKGTQNVNTSVCATQVMDRNCVTNATAANTLIFGLYKESASPFTVKLTAPAAPNQAAVEIGYAALPDSNNNCATGLTKIRPWTATPPSILPGTAYDTAPSGPGGNHPAGIFTNFLNNNGSLNNQRFADATTGPSTNFVITRASNSTPCIVNDCSGATQNAFSTIYTKSYQSQSPLLCVLPASLVVAL